MGGGEGEEGGDRARAQPTSQPTAGQPVSSEKRKGRGRSQRTLNPNHILCGKGKG